SNVGRSGRLLSGLETSAIYIIELFAAIGLWMRRRQLTAWFLATICIVSFTAMGLIIANVSIIYRLRYAFMMLIIVLGTDGVVRLISLSKSFATVPRRTVGIDSNKRIAFRSQAALGTSESNSSQKDTIRDNP